VHTGPFIGSSAERHIARGEAILHAQDCPDKQFPEVIWDQYGIVPTNEVVVTARCGSIRFFATAPSALIVPPMADRIFGTDVFDIQLGHALADRLWERYGETLIAEAAKLRPKEAE
jgi:hypothetical protein